MDPDEIFRRFFGTSFPEFGRRGFGPDKEGDEERTRGSHRGGDVFDDFHRHMQQQMEDMDRQMQDVFRIFRMPTGSSVPQLPDGSVDSRSGSSPRDFMMKEGQVVPPSSGSVDQPSASLQPKSFFEVFVSPWTGLPKNKIPLEDRKDADLDDKTPTSEDIVGLLERREQPSSPSPPPSLSPSPSPFGFGFSGSSFSSKTVIGSDGVTEERTTMKDSSGRVEERVTRREGDSVHTVTTITDSHGRQEKHTTSSHLDTDLMDKLWGGRGRITDSAPVAPADPNSRAPICTPPDGILSDNHRGMFRKFFGF